MKDVASLLIVDDDPHIGLSLQLLLEQHYETVDFLQTPSTLSNQLEQKAYATILLDMNFQPGDTDGAKGLRLLEKVQEISPSSSVIMLTAYGEISMAVQAIKAGATDFVLKPWENEQLLSSVHAAVTLSKSQARIGQLEARQRIFQQEQAQHFSGLIGESAAMKAVIKSLQKVARTNADVLILGENGTGKELVSRSLHQASLRGKKVFMGVDLGAIPESLFESEMFGHKKGAFTDAREDRIGRFEAAEGGSLFLDEIGNIPLALQAKLLSVLQNRQVTRLGSHRSIAVDLRLICATNRDLGRMVKEGSFRQDLWYRINTVTLTLPPLRDRPEDIPALIQHFLPIFSRKYQKKSLNAPDYVLKKLQKYPWPGNVRELQHAVERAVIMAEQSTLRASDFAFLQEDHPSSPTPFPSLDLEVLEKWALSQALVKHQGNISKAAREVGLTRGTFYRRLEKYEL